MITSDQSIPNPTNQASWHCGLVLIPIADMSCNGFGIKNYILEGDDTTIGKCGILALLLLR